MTRIEIPFNKTKLILGTVFSFLFILIGFYMLTSSTDQQSVLKSLTIKSFGIAGILFFGATGIFGIKKMLDKKMGLTINDNGIIDNSNTSSIGLINWTDITEIKTVKIRSEEFLLIYTNNPKGYIEKANKVKQRLLKWNIKTYGTPFYITSNTLSCDIKELERLINDKFSEQRKKMPNS